LDIIRPYKTQQANRHWLRAVPAQHQAEYKVIPAKDKGQDQGGSHTWGYQRQDSLKKAFTRNSRL